jgi:predicted acylesterase/phospholipase RssA
METALVFQGGGALGAYELGVMQRLAKEPWFPPDVVTGVSIGAINAALLVGGRGVGLEALEEAWRRLAMDLPPYLPADVKEAAANFSNPSFYFARTDIANAYRWTYLYYVDPLQRLLSELIDFDKLNGQEASKLVLTAVDVGEGKLQTFANSQAARVLDATDGTEAPATPTTRITSVEHVLASGALPPSFPMVTIGRSQYWDGGVFSNTPMSEAINCFEADGPKLLVVVNLFRNTGGIPQNLQEVGSRFLEILFSNKFTADLKIAGKYNEFVETMAKIRRECPEIDQKLGDDPGWKRMRQYDKIHALVIGPSADSQGVMHGGHDFSRDVLEERMDLGYHDAEQILANDDYRELLRLPGGLLYRRGRAE